MSSENVARSIERVTPLVNWITERHAIYNRRAEGKPKPWSTDPIFQNWRFCNVFRELDTVTIWIRKHIREPFAEHEFLWFMLCIARYINRPSTLEYLMAQGAWPSNPDFEPEMLTKALDRWKAYGETVYTGAYMIRAESNPNKSWYSWSKNRYVSEVVLGRLWNDRNAWNEYFELHDGSEKDYPSSLEKTWERFQRIHYVGWGPFMAYEVVTDLRHTRYLRDAEDIFSWANAGPGALRGLNRLYGRPLKASNRKACGEMHDVLLSVSRTLRPPWKFEIRDIEHSLCEFDKYERVRLGEGTPRSSYNGKG